MKGKYIALILLVTVVGISSYFYIGSKKNDLSQDVSSKISHTILVTEEPTPLPTPTSLVFDRTAPAGLTGFFEDMPIVATQQAYVAYPLSIEVDNPPDLVIYYHGSTQKITMNFSDTVMKNMREYANYFADNNIAFLASNQHGDNWGSETAVNDSTALIKWVSDKYPTSGNIYVLGFSMGGQPAMKHVIMHPTDVKKIALLAPANQVEYYSAAQIQLFKNVPLEIWHGTADVNVPYWATELLVKEFKKQSTPVVVHTLEGKVHWDVDTEYKEAVYDFFVK